VSALRVRQTGKTSTVWGTRLADPLCVPKRQKESRLTGKDKHLRLLHRDSYFARLKFLAAWTDVVAIRNAIIAPTNVVAIADVLVRFTP
jgi:hypothetical protein